MIYYNVKFKTYFLTYLLRLKNNKYSKEQPPLNVVQYGPCTVSKNI